MSSSRRTIVFVGVTSGWRAGTSLGRDFPRIQAAFMHAMCQPARHGAAPVAHLATAPDITAGAYYDRFTPVPSSAESYNRGVARRL